MDFIERENEFVLRADIPGVHKVGRQEGCRGWQGLAMVARRGQAWEGMGRRGQAWEGIA